MLENTETTHNALTTMLRSLTSPDVFAALHRSTREDFAASIAVLSREFGVTEASIRAHLRMTQQRISQGIRSKNYKLRKTQDSHQQADLIEKGQETTVKLVKGVKDGKSPSSRG